MCHSSQNFSATALWLAISVVAALLPLTDGQAYHFIISQQQRNFDQYHRESRTSPPDTNYTETATADLENNNNNNNNSTIIVTTVSQSNDLSQTAMDIITIVWYVATFLALAAFFLLMACSDRRCSDAQRNANMNINEAPIPPPTPSPSYSEFAPPSYDSVMKMHRTSKPSIFVVPFASEQNSAKDNNNISPNTNTNSTTTTTTTTAPCINLYTINELQKLAS